LEAAELFIKIYSIKSFEKLVENPSVAVERLSMFPWVACPGGCFRLVLYKKCSAGVSCGLGGGEQDRFLTTSEV